MTAVQATRATTRSNESAHTRPAFAVVPSVSNKPMVPTAPNGPTANPLYPMRRHIGQSFGSFNERWVGGRGNGQRPKEDQMAGHGKREAGCCQQSSERSA